MLQLQRSRIVTFLLPIILMVVALNGAQAQLKIEVVRASNQAVPISLIDSNGASAGHIEVISNDLGRSGRFKPKTSGHPENVNNISALNADRWRAADVKNAVFFNLQGATLEVVIGDAFNKQVIASRKYNYLSNGRAARRQAHQIADFIYETILGVKGSFDSRVAYVSHRGGRNFSLIVADADGENPQTILDSNEPILSPAWSPDARRLAYASFEGKNNQIVVQDLSTGNRHVVVSENGINSAPSWSPDGNQLVFTLSRDGNPEIYIANANGSNLRRMTNHPGIDTEPVWGRDGMIYFTSDRGGNSQIYRMSANGGPAERITFQGNYNGNASISADGKWLAMMQRIDGRGFGIAVMNLQTGSVKRLTNGGKDEAPSFSGNGHMIVYSDGRGGLNAISSDGSIEQRFRGVSSDVRKPSWSPNLQQ